jgi:hypothetical protein
MRGNIPSELAPKDWSRFADNVWRLPKATKRVHRDEMEALATKALSVIQLELDSIPRERIPSSVSIFQFTLGVLTKGRLVGAKLQRFYPMITPELWNSTRKSIRSQSVSRSNPQVLQRVYTVAHF